MKRTWSYIAILILSFFILHACHSGRYKPVQTFRELPDPTQDTSSDWSGCTSGLHSSFVTIDKRYAKSLYPEIDEKKEQQLAGWKGERLSAQVLLWTKEAMQGVEVHFSDFVSKTDTLPADIGQARFIRYVMTDEFGEGCGYRQAEDYKARLVADMLDSLDRFDLPEQKVRPVWLTIRIPENAPSGNYTTQISITSEQGEHQRLELYLEIMEQTLPPPSAWTFHLDQWQHPAAVARVDSVPLWSDRHFQAMKPIMQMLADAGQKVITTTLNKDPWNVQTFDPYADMIFWTKTSDGTWTYDYAIFDKWVEFMMGLGVDQMINCYSIIPWNNEIHYYDEAKKDTIDIVAKPGTPVFEEIWTPFLQDFSKHLANRGWLKITNIAMDERDRESMDAALNLLHRVAPQLGVSYADNQKSFQRYPNSEDISVSAYHPLDPGEVKDRKRRGLNTTFYICCADPFPNQFTFSEPAESTYLAWYAMARDLNGVLRWAFNSWVENPLQDSRFRTWPAGDTYIVYPQGRSSIRYERMLEGIQDFEKVRILRTQLHKKGARQQLVTLNAAIEKLGSVQRTKHWNQDLNAAKGLLYTYSK